MRKHQQRQILELLKTISEAQTDGLYIDCQEGAIGVGEYIESIEGEGTHTVTLLEEYCELLYKASNGEVGEKQLRKHLIQVENSVKSELKPNRIEIVFLSYKASMSDSIESIYLAAKDDPQCDAYWIPIPYYDRESDGSFSTMHYEGAECYGNNIEVTDWQQYDIEARRPDVVFTFNPYDAGNYVTSVHPDFYCERLRGLTDLLVYVPYFVVIDDVPEHFVTTAGCVYADKVIVQSEKIRETYIRVFKERFGNKYGKAEEKFVDLGSPKFDKVTNAKRGDYNLPIEWHNLIWEKKTVFYNTSVGSMLADNEQYLKKLRYVLDMFRNRDDVVLWWRPHPLSESTYQSMRPQLYEEYKQIIINYKREGWGIYDDTPDMHRAIAWTDAYYGDRSSIVALYEVTGKPVLLQDNDIVSESDEMLLKFENLYNDGQYFWFTEYRFNSLFRIDKQSWNTEWMGAIPNENALKNRLYNAIALCNGKLYFSPLSANEIAEYSIENGKFRKISFDPPLTTKYSQYELCKFGGIIVVGTRVFFIPSFYPGIICYDTVTETVSYHDDWVSRVEHLRTAADVGFFGAYLLDCTRIILACACADAIVVFDTDKMTSEVWPSPSSDYKYKYHGVCCDGDFYYFISGDGTIIKRKMQSQNEEITKLDLLDFNFSPESDRLAFFPMRYLDGFIWLFPFSRNEAWKIDLNTSKVQLADVFNDEKEYKSDFQSFLGAEIADGHIYAMTGRSARFIEYDPVNNNKRESNITVSEMDSLQIEELLTDCFFTHRENICFTESSIFSLMKMLNGLTHINTRNNEHTDNYSGTAGRKIYEFIRKEASQR